MLKSKPAQIVSHCRTFVSELTTGQTTSQGLSPHLSHPAPSFLQTVQSHFALHRLLGLPLPLAPDDLRRTLQLFPRTSQSHKFQLLLQHPACHHLWT